MKKSKQKVDAMQTRMPQMGGPTLLAAALIASGILSPITLPSAVAASLPIPMNGLPCGGCAPNTPATALRFVQAGDVAIPYNPYIIDPLTGLPTTKKDENSLIINQKSQTAILNWQQFNIAPGNSVTFNQTQSDGTTPNNNASALNRIWSVDPSTIAGNLHANGQIYLINQNGIVFAKGASVDTGALIASSLDIKDDLYQAGYLTNIQAVPAFGDGINGLNGFIKVDKEATLSGSRVMLFAPVVENNGSINSVKGGQVVLAAGDKVYLEASSDPNLRGVLVEVDINTPGLKDSNGIVHGVVTNTSTGKINSEHGNITLIGYAVNQQGVASATTSVTENGSIKLLARYTVDTSPSLSYTSTDGADTAIYTDIRAKNTGSVTLAKGSVTQVTIDKTDSNTTTDGQGFKPSIVEVMGKTVNVLGSIIANGGKVNLVAVGRIDPTAGVGGNVGDGIYQQIHSKLSYSSFLNPNYKPVAALDGARVFLDNGSLIDVSGNTASVSVARNILDVQLRGSQLADAPLQKSGPLYGQTVHVDMRQGTPLANYSGEEAQVGRTVAERTSAGGNVLIASSGDAVMNPNAVINISGGQVNYTGANINPSSLISNGKVYDIANASPNRIYDGISGVYTQKSNKWGVTQTFSTMAGGDLRGRWDAGYVEGQAAGSVTLLAPNAAIAGKIIANTVSGIYQRQPYVDLTGSGLITPAYKDTWQMQAKGGTLTVGYNGKGVQNTVSKQYNFLTDTDVVVKANAQQTKSYAVDDVAPLPAFMTLDTNLFSNGLSNLAVYTNGKASIDANTAFNLAPGGSVALKGGQVDMLGSINVAGGSVSLATVATRSFQAGDLNVVGNISTRGTWVNDSAFFGPPDTSKVIVKQGGNISVNAGNVLNLASGLALDASAGGWVDQSGKAHGGNGGNISLVGNILNADLNKIKLSSYGVGTGKGGSLKLVTGDLKIGGVPKDGTTRILPVEFFQHGGFTSYNIISNGSLTVDGLIQPKAESLILNRDAAFLASGTDVYALSTVGFLPDWQRNPANITLEQKGVTGTLKIEENAKIEVDPAANITLKSANQLTVLGTLDAAAGTINLDLTLLTDFYDSKQSIWLGKNSKLLTRGYFKQGQPNKQNLTQGQVLAGGKINITTNAGYVVAQKGSLMDVSGSAADIDLPKLQAGSLVYSQTHVAGDAGAISVQTGGGVIFDGDMKAGVEAGSKAAAGSFSLTLNNDPQLTNPSVYADVPGGYPLKPAQIQVVASGNGSFAANNQISSIDQDAGKVSLNALAGRALLDASALQKSGFDRVKLKSDNAIVLADQVTLQTRRSITLDAPVLVSNGVGNVKSAHVTLSNLVPALQATPSPVAGIGALNVDAQMVDLTGNFTVSGVDKIKINSTGDIRLNGIIDSRIKDAKGQPTAESLTGSLRTQGDVTLTADQVYTSTLAQFKVAVEDGAGSPKTAGSIAIKNNGTDPLSTPILSAGGKLTLSAFNIAQEGVLKAPMGSIDLEGSNQVKLSANSITSVSAEGQTIPFGMIQGGNSWYYNGIPITAPPQKIVRLKAPDIKIESATANKKAAIVDLSGGGDLYANEFFAGSGGTVNVLDPSKAPANTFAIIPGLSAYSPYDPQLSGQYEQTAGSKTTLQSGDSVYLAGGNGLQAGYYTLLPASYALLPGAYRVTAVAGYADMQPGQLAPTLADGSQIMAGKFAFLNGADIQDARYSGFMVSPGSVVRTQSEYHDSYANKFFAQQAAASDSVAPRTPMDAGQLIVDATGTLQLDGSFRTQPGAKGRGAWIDLNGPKFDIVNAAGSVTAGYVELTTSMLNNLGAESLLIGGVRKQTAEGTSIVVGATNVLVDNNGASLSGAEILLAAKDTVTVKAGSSVQGNGVYVGKPQNITIGDANSSGDGALLRVSAGEQVTVKRVNSSGARGVLTVEDGATLAAQNSLLLDASHITKVGGGAIISGKALSMAANSIDIGNNASGANTNALGLTNALLSQMQNFQDITLHSYNDINFYGAATLGGVDAQGKHLISNLALNAKSLNGIDNAGNTTSIDAGSVTLMNNNGAAGTALPNGSGTLQISADRIVLGEGAKTIRGFDNVALNAAQKITGQGKGTLMLTSANINTHSLQLQGTLTGMGKSDQTITADTFDTVILAPSPGVAATADIGAKLAINAKSILDQGIIDLAAGSVTLHATGTAASDGVTLDSTSRTSVAGAEKIIAGQKVYASAGSIKLVSDNGKIELNSKAEVDVSGGTAGGDAGSLSITASKGAVTVAGKQKGSAAAGYAQGSFVLDAKTLTDTLTALNKQLMSGGFNQSIDMRIRTGDLKLDEGSMVKAHTFHVAADRGSIDVYGTVDASGTTGGDILLAANNNLTLHTNALLDASATGSGNNGGKVTLETTAGTIELNNQRIKVDGGPAGDKAGAGAAGRVLLRAPQIAPLLDPVTHSPVLDPATNNVQYTDVSVKNNGGTSLNVSLGADVTVEAFRTYSLAVDATNTSTIGATDVNSATSPYFIDATKFADNYAYAIKNRLGMTSEQHLTPGVELDSPGNLTLASNWDMSTWRFNNGNKVNSTGLAFNTEPGILTLRAAGDLNFGTAPTTDAKGAIAYHTASLSDGFTSATSFDLLTVNPSSWSYRLVAGADSIGANPLSVNNTATGDILLAPGGYDAGAFTTNRAGQRIYTRLPSTTFEIVRTGTGTLDFAAGGNFYLGNGNSTIYTAGQLKPLPGNFVANRINKAVFTTGGGDINIAVKGNISAVGRPDTNGQSTGSAVNQLFSNWLFTSGSADGSFRLSPAWWVNFGSFAQNIGVLGGGNLNISAGGDITSLSAVVPSTGYVAAPGGAATLVTGGNLSVKAGGNIDSGIFYVGNGQGAVRAGGALGTSRSYENTNLYTILALGQGNIDVKTGGDLNLQTVLNPTILAGSTKFFTYGDNSSVSLESLNGNVLLSNDTNFYQENSLVKNLAVSPFLNPSVPLGSNGRNGVALAVYPATLSITALNGSITNGIDGFTGMTMFPSASGNLNLIAASDINFNSSIYMLDANPAGLQANTPSYTVPSMEGHGIVNQLPLHSGDSVPVIIAAGDSIYGNNNVGINLTLPKSADIQAGRDIINLSMSVQNVNSGDTTSLMAGRDILFTPNVAYPSSATKGIDIAGSGQLVLQAGRNVDLGQSSGLVSNGNLSNPYLPVKGADITVLAGVGQGVTATQAFIDKYIDPVASTFYGKDLIAYAGKYKSKAKPDQTAADAFSIFKTLSKPLQEAFARQVFFSELKKTGRSAVNTGKYQAGYDAIATLFPTTGYKGDINLYYSQIKTQRGGDINLLTPGGGVNAGLANPSSSGPQKTASQLGVVTVGGGDVNAFVNNDFIVNQSRVFTLQGGNILMWSSYGDIDAGKGSKSVSSTPPPLLVVDPKTGIFQLDVTGSVVGSGIRVLLANKDVKPGDVDLIAPAGTVNAGDAGIGSAGNITIAAQHVVGADNINFGGVSAGVPVAAPAPVSVGLGNLTDASKAAEQATQGLGNMNDMNANDFKPNFLSVEVIGLGDQDTDSKKDKDKSSDI